jgi:KDO2-lipid IV(A) lauroyltransferase
MAKAPPVLSYLAALPQILLLGLLRILPYRARLGLAAALMRGAVALVPNLRARVDGNLRLIFPRFGEADRRRIRNEMADNFGRTYIEILTAKAFQACHAWREPAGPGWPILLDTLSRGGGALLVSGHFGQWEAVRGALKERGTEVAALYRPLKNRWLEPTYRANLEMGGRPIFPRGGAGLRDLVRHLKSGGVVAVLLDQYTKRGAPIEFLGHPAPTGTMVADLALKYGVPMIPVYATRDPDGLHVAIDFEPPIPPTTALEMTQAAADSLAARVRACPGQYYWLHRRWVKRF